MSVRTSDDHPLGYGLARLQRTLIGALDRALAPLGLTSSRYGVLWFLERKPEMTAAELARRSYVTPQTMMRMVAGLTEAGLVERGQDTANARALPVRLTEAGRQVLSRAHERVAAVEAELIAGETSADLSVVTGFVDRGTERLDGFSADQPAGSGGRPRRS